MPLRFPCTRRVISPALLMHPYWPRRLFSNVCMDVWLICGQDVTMLNAGLDTRSDYVVVSSGIAPMLGLTLPFARQAAFSGAAGTQAGTLSFPPDGLVGLFVTDYTEYCYLPASPIGFHPPSSQAHLQRSVLGMTGFLQHFDFLLALAASVPYFELRPGPKFPGQTGPLPKTGPLLDFIRSLHSP